jgi:DnaJ homolog subfamily B member 12
MNGQEVSPEELFEMFFRGGQGMRGGSRTFHFGGGRGRGGGRAAADQDDPQGGRGGGGGFMQILQLLPILLLFMMSFGGSSPSSYDNTSSRMGYSLTKEAKFSLPKSTSLLGSDIHIPYYVSDNFAAKYGKSASELKKVEQQVYFEYQDVLFNKCSHEKERKRARIEQVSTLISISYSPPILFVSTS